jgi:hypothetical protein
MLQIMIATAPSSTASAGRRLAGRFSLFLKNTNHSATLPQMNAVYKTIPAVGRHDINCLESSPVGNPTYNGTETDMQLMIQYRG